jgi:hypothetical protein
MDKQYLSYLTEEWEYKQTLEEQDDEACHSDSRKRGKGRRKM